MFATMAGRIAELAAAGCGEAAFPAAGRGLAAVVARIGLGPVVAAAESGVVSVSGGPETIGLFGSHLPAEPSLPAGYPHDAAGQVTTVTDPRGGTTAFTYAGRLASSTDRLGRRVDHAYDAAGQQTGEAWVEDGSMVGRVRGPASCRPEPAAMLTTKRGNVQGVTHMGWERGRYYTRSRRDGGRVVRVYIGAGPAADLLARADAAERDRRKAERIEARLDLDQVAALDAPVAALNELADLVARAALLAAGLRQHHRSDWRRPRARPRPAG